MTYLCKKKLADVSERTVCKCRSSRCANDVRFI